MQRIAALLSISFAASSASVVGDQAAAVLPTCPPGWKLEVVAAAPAIRHPSVVCCAPDGRVFVAEDPMDISAPSADLALGRILCFHLDGRVTVFADKLYAVFGLQYLEGKLYVLHNPKFSVFTDDDGVGKDRFELIESTNPNPWALDWNDHVPANFRLAMDGYFYVAVGDKGVYGAVGRDGKRVDLHGGGILRLRPDGTELEVFSTGVRNILDVAINAEDDIFTYDNTDEQQWMSRLTHMVDGGFYGYPYDFIPRRPYTLWMMADYGGGAATGALAYNEDALPPEYHGNLFLADFGKRQLLRVRIVRDGGTYQAGSREDFFTNVPDDFRPVGIALAPDGLGLYICDWNYRDTKAKVEVGRLFKVSYLGRNHAAPKPDWYLPAALGKQDSATTEELLEALSHPSQSVRLGAQRRIHKAGQVSSVASNGLTRRLSGLLAETNAPPHARWHAIWTLDALDGGTAGRNAILHLASDREASVRRQAIRQLGARRAKLAADAIVDCLHDPEGAVRFHAATALGRIGHTPTIPALLMSLGENDPFVRYAVFTALNRIGRSTPSAWKTIVEGLRSADPMLREGAAFALRETWDDTLVSVLAETAQDQSASAEPRIEAFQLLSSLHRQRPAWRGEWWAYHPVNSPQPERTVEWAGTPIVTAVLRSGLADPSPAIRLAAIRGVVAAREAGETPALLELYRKHGNLELRRELLNAFGALGAAPAAGLIASMLKDPTGAEALLSEAIGAAEQIGGEELSAAIAGFVRSGPSNKDLLLNSIEALGSLKATDASALLARYASDSDADLREHALGALVRIGDAAAAAVIVPLLDHESALIRREAVTALGALKNQTMLPHLLKAWEREETRVEAAIALARVPDSRAIDAYLAGLKSKSATVRESCRKAIHSLNKVVLPAIESKLPSLSPEVVAELQDIYRDQLEFRTSPLFGSVAKDLKPADYLDAALNSPGRVDQGWKIFADPGRVACGKCHRVGAEGGQVGPDLTTIGSQFSRRELAESILFPSKAIREGYQQIIAETNDGDVFAGLLKAETPDALTLLDSEGKLHAILKARLAKRRSSELSLMPEGLHRVLSLEEFADLVAFLASLRN